MAEPSTGRCEYHGCAEPVPLDDAQHCAVCGGFYCDHHLHLHDVEYLDGYVCTDCLAEDSEDGCCDDPDCACHDDPDWPEGELVGPPMEVVFASPAYL